MAEHGGVPGITALQRPDHSSDANLWTNALGDLTRTEQDCIRSHLNEPANPEELLLVSHLQRDETWKKRLSVKRRNGEKIFIYDIFGKIAKWIQKFISIGDVPVQYDPAQAALPWAVVRFVLQACISDVQKCAFILESMEKVSEIVTWSRIHEKLYLIGNYEATATLKSALVSLYTRCWSVLAKIVLYFDQHKLKRVLSSVFDTEMEASDNMARLEENRKRVDRTASLVASETLFRQNTLAQERHRALITHLEDMQMPTERVGAVTDESYRILVTWQRDQVLDSISNIPYVNHHKEVYRKVLQESGKWLLDSPITQTWLLSSSSQMLWLHGIIGSGKSCLVSIMIEYLLQQARAGRISFPAYFYCSRNTAEASRAKPEQILRSVLRQLADSRSGDALPHCLIDSSNSPKSLDKDEIVDLIINVAETRRVTHIVIDGLDECDADLLFEIIDGFEAILGRTQSLVKIFVSSRNDLDLIRWLQAYPNKEILSSDNQSDIDRFVSSEVDRRILGPSRRFRARKISDDLREHIKATLKAEANGMFRWVKLQLQYIGTLYTENDIRRRLGSLPKSLHDIYNDVYEKNMSIHRETDPEYEVQAKTIFHLLLSSRQTWRLSDMANLIDPSEDWADPETEKITGLTFDLVTHDKELNIIRFAHLSVREYLERNHPDFCDSLRAHECIAISCIEYLEKTENFIYSPVEYPGDWWIYHSLQALRSDRLRRCFFGFLVENIAAIRSWTFKWMQEKNRRFHLWLPGEDFCYVDGRIDRLACEPPSTILKASLLGLVDVVNALLRADASCVTRRSFSGDSPLSLACEMGHAEVASILIQNTVRDDTGVFEDAALCVAIKNGHGQIIRQFLSSGYNLQKRAESHGGEHLVWLAVNSGRKDVVAQLLEAGASVYGEGGIDFADTALYTASAHCADLVDLLLQYGADPRTQDGRDGYAIYMAARFNNLLAARLLVEYGADVNANNSGDRPYTARYKRYEGKWPLPVSCEGTSNFCNYPRAMPLSSAVDKDHVEMVAFLLGCGADPVPRFPEDRDIFRKAMERKSVTGTQLLALVVPIISLAGEEETLARINLHELNPDSKAVSCALYVAAEQSHIRLLTMLIEYALARDFGRGVFVSALLQCARHSRTAIFWTLWAAACYQDGCPVLEEDWRRDQHVEYGTRSDLNGYSNCDPFLLSLSNAASTSKSVEILDILSKAQLHSTVYHLNQFSEGCKRTSRQEWLTKTLVEVAGKGRLDELRLLLDAGADPNAFIRYKEEIPLIAAIYGQHEEAVEILLEHGADPSLQIRKVRGYYTTLPLLAASGQPNAVKILGNLLKHGATVNGRPKEGFGPSKYRQRYEIYDESIANDDNLSNDTFASDDDRERNEIDAFSPDNDSRVDVCQEDDTQHSDSQHGDSLDDDSQDNDSQDYNSETSDTRRDRPGDKSVLAQAIARALRPDPNPSRRQSSVSGNSSDSAAGTSRTRIVELLLQNNKDGHIIPRALVPAMYDIVQRDTLEFGTLQFLLAHGVDVNWPSGQYASPLSALIELAEGPADLKPPDSPREQIIDLLIAHGADLNATHFEASNALQFACQNGTDERMITCLLSKGADVNAPGGRFGNALQAACYKHCDLKVVELLLLQGADVNACDDPKDLAVVEYLLQMGADVNLRGGRYGTALICACIMCNDPAVELLLDHGVDVTYTNNVYGNALHAACMAGSASTVQLLLRRGVSADERGDIYDHAIFAAVFHYRDDSFEALRIVANHMRDLNIQHADYGTPLIAAVLAGERDSVQVLLERGAEVNLQGGTYGTALQAAATHSNMAILYLLLKYNADVNALGGIYGSALQAASARGNSRVQVERRNSNATNSTDRVVSTTSMEDDNIDVISASTSSAHSDSSAEPRIPRFGPKHVREGMPGMVDLLIKYGADVNAKGGAYGTSLHAAIHLRYDDVAKKLLAHGARPTDEIAFCFVEELNTQCGDRFVNGELQPFEDMEGENSYLFTNFDRVGEQEHRSIHLDEDKSDTENKKRRFGCGTGRMQWAEEKQRKREKRRNMVLLT